MSIAPRLPVADLQRSVDYYSSVLGFRSEDPNPELSEFAILCRDNCQLQLIKADRWHPPGHFTIWLQVAEVLALHSKLASLTPIEWGPEEFPYGRREFAVLDSNGHRVILSEPTDEPTTCTKANE